MKKYSQLQSPTHQQKATTPQTQATKEEKDEEALLLKLQQLRKQRVHLELLIRNERTKLTIINKIETVPKTKKQKNDTLGTKRRKRTSSYIS